MSSYKTLPMNGLYALTVQRTAVQSGGDINDLITRSQPVLLPDR